MSPPTHFCCSSGSTNPEAVACVQLFFETGLFEYLRHQALPGEGVPSLKRNKGPGWDPLTDTIAEIGQRGGAAFPRKMSTPRWKGSVLLCLASSMKERSENPMPNRPVTGGPQGQTPLKGDSEVSRTKKAKESQTAQIMGELEEGGRCRRINLRISGVMGRREWEGMLAEAWDLLMPLRIPWRRG